MIGKFINVTTQLQIRCRSSDDYVFLERPHIRDMLMRDCVMDPDVHLFIFVCYPNLILSPLTLQMQRSRMSSPSDTDEVDDSFRLHLPRTSSRDCPQPPRDAALIRRLMSGLLK